MENAPPPPPPPHLASEELHRPLGFAEVVLQGFRMLKLDASAVDEVRGARSELSQGVWIAAIAGALTGLGSTGPFGLIYGALQAVLVLFLAAFLIHVVADLMGGRGDLLEFAKVLGIAHVVRWLGILPVVGGIVGKLWFMVVMVVVLERFYRLGFTKALVVAFLPVLLLVAGMILTLLGTFVFLAI